MSVEAGQRFADRFVLEELAGRGAMGEVWRARDGESAEPVALKLLVLGGNEERFGREARVLAALSHPAIVRYVAHGAGDAGAWLAMEWLEGEDLERRLARQPLTAAETLSVARRAAGALAAAHERGVVHRDIKPSNLLLVGGEPEGAKVVDFGIARRRAAVSMQTKTGTLLGTPAYMAPEQARGEAAVDARADVFSLGCVLFECLTGRAAFQGTHLIAILTKVLLDEAPPAGELCDAPAALSDLVDRMLSKDPSARPADGRALSAELAAIDPGSGRRAQERVSARSLGRGEFSLVSVVLAGHALAEAFASSPTLGAGEAPAQRETGLSQAVEEAGGRLERLADGSLAALISGEGVATDRAARAARLGLALRAEHPSAPVVLATGRGQRLLVGEAIDRAAALLAMPVAAGVRVDPVTAGLLDARFDLGADLVLRAEREAAEEARTLLGKPTRCLGREREIGVLLATFEECVSEPVARAVVLTAPAGVGKSRVRHEVLNRLRARGGPVEIWLARGEPVGAGSALGMLAQIVRRAARIQGGEPLETQQEKLRARVARHLPEAGLERTVEFLGEIARVPFRDETSPALRAARRDAMVMGDNMRRAFEDFLEAEARAGPVLVVLEDLHWGDLPTVSFLDGALRSFPDLGWMVLALGRPEMERTFPGLWAERGSHKIALGPLGKKASAELVREALGARADEPATARILQCAGGNAFFLEELVRAAAEGKEQSETVLAMVQTRIEELDPEARRVLRAASVFGQTFWRGGVCALLGASNRTREVQDRLAELARREIVTRRAESGLAGEEEWVFRHALVRDAAYRTLLEADRILGHRLAGEWLLQAGERDGLGLAEHFLAGDDMERAGEMFLRSARDALGGNDHAAATERAERGAQAGAGGARLGELRLVQAEAQSWQGANVEAARCAGEAMGLLEPGSARWFEAARWVCVAHTRLGARENAVGVTAALLAAVPRERAAGAGALATAAANMLLLGERERADQLLAGVDESAADDAARARIALARGTEALHAGDPSAYLVAEERAAELFEAAADRRQACVARVNAGYALALLGEAERAAEALEEVLREAERMGLARVASAARQNLGLALMFQGKLEEARRVEDRARRDLAERGDAALEGGSRAYLAEILLASGDAVAAAAEARRAAELLCAAPPLRPYALAVLARAELRCGDVAAARKAAGEAMDGVGVVEDGEAAVRLAFAEVLHAADEREAAREAIATARRRLLERADKISNAALRKSFLEKVPDHARTLALARAWLSANQESGPTA